MTSLRLEALEARQQGGQQPVGAGEEEEEEGPAAWLAAWSSVRATHVYLPHKGGAPYIPVTSADPSDVIAALRAEYDRLQAAFTSEAGRLSKAEARVGVTTKGFEMRAAAQNKALVASHQEAVDKGIELQAYARLGHDEAGALTSRLAGVTAELGEEFARQSRLQSAYASALREIDDLRRQLAMAGVEADAPVPAAGAGAGR